MPRLSWNEIESRAAEFAARWGGETYERGESQTFWSQFLEIYGVDRRRHGAFFEYAIKKTGGKQGFIDLFWPGKLIVEQKSAGRDLEKAKGQAYDYLPAMPDHDLPQAIIVCDFQMFQVLNTATNQTITFTLDQLPRRVREFAFLIDETTKYFADEDPVNRKAAEQMAALHNQLEANRYSGHDLELVLVRLVFCLFADDARIFERNAFAEFIRTRTRDDGTDLGPMLVTLFEVLNTPEDERQTTLDADLMAFPYINGGLFQEPIRTAHFTSAMRHDLLTATHVDWARVSPAIFGSMFQSVMDPAERRYLGAHYTSEKNILRLIQPLFLDDLYAEFEREKVSRSRLERFHQKLATLTFLDPACGCGNFLVITYRELRRLEHKVVQELYRGQQILDLKTILRVNVDQMYGIEIEEFPSLIAQTALWLTDHQMNIEATQLLGQHYVRLPLTASATIVHANALRIDWAEVIAPEELDYILGNPPFVGQTWQSIEQRADLARSLPDVAKARSLDFVAAWYGKATEYMRANPRIQAALVATSSICQGEQVGYLWPDLQAKGVKINFAHQSFKWSNDARGVAQVHCVIVGFSLTDRRPKTIFEYMDARSDPLPRAATNINAYLVDAPDVFVQSRRRPINAPHVMTNGNKPVDGGHLILSDIEREALVSAEPQTAKYIKRLIGSREFLQGKLRWCLWLVDVEPGDLRRMPLVLDRVAKVKQVRENSIDPGAQRLALRPTQFRDTSNPSRYIAIPEVSSERREYIPIGFFDDEVICTNKIQLVVDADQYELGILTSAMHMSWMRYVAGRLKSDFSYSKDIVYNNFPWPEVTEAQRERLAELAQAILDARKVHPESTLADLYDPLTMPADLRKAHEAVDRFVDRLYRKQPFVTDADRVALLFRRYQELTSS